MCSQDAGDMNPTQTPSALGERLRALPEPLPPSAGWAAMQARMDRQTRQRRHRFAAGFAMAASLLVVIGASLATAAVGLSPIVGALIAGLLIAETEYHAEVETIMEPFKGLALGIFLITVGMSIDLQTIWENFRATWRRRRRRTSSSPRPSPPRSKEKPSSTTTA